VCGKQHDVYIVSGGWEGADDDPIHVHGVKHRSSLQDLPYWIVSMILFVHTSLHAKWMDGIKN